MVTPSPPRWSSKDWYAAEGQLHFFPGVRALVWVVRRSIVARAEAWGGEEPDPRHRDPVMKPQKTTPGTYVVHSYAPYRTRT